MTHAEVSRNESAGMFRKEVMTALVFAGKAVFIRRSADDVRGGFHNMVKLGGISHKRDLASIRLQ